MSTFYCHRFLQPLRIMINLMVSTWLILSADATSFTISRLSKPTSIDFVSNSFSINILIMKSTSEVLLLGLNPVCIWKINFAWLFPKKNLKKFDRRGIFLEHHNTFFVSELGQYIPSHNHSKEFRNAQTAFWGVIAWGLFRNGLYCWTAKSINSEKNFQSSFFILILYECSVEPNLLNLCEQATMAFFGLFRQYANVSLAFRHWRWLKLNTEIVFNRKSIIGVTRGGERGLGPPQCRVFC